MEHSTKLGENQNIITSITRLKSKSRRYEYTNTLPTEKCRESIDKG